MSDHLLFSILGLVLAFLCGGYVSDLRKKSKSKDIIIETNKEVEGASKKVRSFDFNKLIDFRNRHNESRNDSEGDRKE